MQPAYTPVPLGQLSCHAPPLLAHGCISSGAAVHNGATNRPESVTKIHGDLLSSPALTLAHRPSLPTHPTSSHQLDLWSRRVHNQACAQAQALGEPDRSRVSQGQTTELALGLALLQVLLSSALLRRWVLPDIDHPSSRLFHHLGCSSDRR